MECSHLRDYFRRIFLCDSDALIIDTDFLLEILADIRRLFPDLEGVRMYASAKDVLRKSERELSMLGEAGLDMVFLGLESGSDKVLKKVNKGITKQEMIDASKLLKAAKIKQSVTVIAGLAGEDLMVEHAVQSADALNQMQPEYLAVLVLHSGGENIVVPPASQVVKEMKLLLQHLELENCFFSSAHISNYVNLRGNLPEDKQRMLEMLESAGPRF